MMVMANDDASSASGMMVMANDDDNSSIAAFGTDQPQTSNVPKELQRLNRDPRQSEMIYGLGGAGSQSSAILPSARF